MKKETRSSSVSFYEISSCFIPLAVAFSSRSACSTKAALCVHTVASLLQFWTLTRISCSANCLTLWHFALLPPESNKGGHLLPLCLNIVWPWPFVFAHVFFAYSGTMHECHAVGDADGEAEGRIQRAGETLLPGWASLLHSLEALTQEWEGQEWVWTHMCIYTPADVSPTACISYFKGIILDFQSYKNI